jgi:phosphonate transport system substrate-binding protein
MRSLNKLLAVAGLALGFTATSHAEPPKEINLGIISTESTQNLKQDWEVLVQDMQKHTGVKVNAFFAPDYAGIIEGMRFNKVQVAWFGNKSGMEAVDRASGEIFAQQIAEDGAPGYWSYLIVPKDSPLNSIEDVKKNAKNLALGYGDPNSTSGFLVPGYYAMALHDLDPKTSFKRMRTANHETNLMAVASKQVDLATNNNESFEKFARRHPDKAKDIKVIWKSPLIPSDPMIWRSDLDPKLKASVKEFFVAYGKNEREKAALKKIGIGGFKASDNNQLLPIRQLELFKAKNKIEADSAMDAAEKKSKLTEIDKKLADLNQKMAALK